MAAPDMPGGDFGKFALVGLLATGSQYAVLALGTGMLGLSAGLSSGVGYLLGSLVSYAANYAYTFRSDQLHRRALPRFYLMVAAAWLLTVGLMALLVDWLGWNKWLGQLLVTAVCFIFNYIGSRLWVFAAPR